MAPRSIHREGRLRTFGARVMAGAALAALAALAPSASPSQAAFSGSNGKIAFESERDGNTEIYVMNQDGSNQTNVTNDPADSFNPAWSPDGTRIAYNGIKIMNADGTNKTFVSGGVQPAWSPDGAKIAFISNRDGTHDLYTMNADGTGVTRLTNDRSLDWAPAWSPDGQKIVFRSEEGRAGGDIVLLNTDGTGRNVIVRNPDYLEQNPVWSPNGAKIVYEARIGPQDLYSVNPDGTGSTKITNGTADYWPTWSPDGLKLAFASVRDGHWRIWTMNPDGTGAAPLTAPGQDARNPDWQSLHGYPRPQAGRLFRVPLVIAFEQCSPASANRTHAGGLPGQSCNPAHATAGHATVGALDANGKLSQSVGFLLMESICNPPAPNLGPPCTTAGDQADISLEARITDVRSKSDLTDYVPSLYARGTLRITDRLNGSSNTDPATVSDLDFSFGIPCAPTASGDVGSTCSVSTHFDMIAPGTVPEGKRANWEMAAWRVFDAGNDTIAGTADDTLFMRQGAFVP